MELRITLHIVALISSACSILINPDEIVTYPGTNCSGRVDYILCNCVNSKMTIDIQLSPGYYNFTNQQFCLLENKTAISITGSTNHDTIIQCVEPFSIVFMSVQNVTISNIKMINCGDVVNEVINKTIKENIQIAYFGSGFRFTIMFYEAVNVSITEFTMLGTLGYGIIAFNMMGEVSMSKLHIENTTFENDLKCINHMYDINEDHFNCSGSGLLIMYFDTYSTVTYNTTLNINQNSFKNNRNLLPSKVLNLLDDVIKTSVFRVPIPIPGAGSITIFYLQTSFNVDTIISDTLFQNNSGTLSAAIVLASLSAHGSKTNIEYCSFLRNTVHHLNTKYFYSRGGVSYYYLNDVPEMPVTLLHDRQLMVSKIFNITQCNFTETFGQSIHIDTVFSKLVLVEVRIEYCTFRQNTANVGSAVVAVDHRFDDSSISGGLTVHLVNVHADNNDILPDATLQYSSTNDITGVFSSHNAQFIFNCSISCTFVNNRPSVYYGRSSSVTLSGNAVFYNNSARYGGALHLLNTVAFIYEHSELYFHQNYAVVVGGAIDILFTYTSVQSEVTCPIQFVGMNSPITHLNETDRLNVSITFKNNTAGASDFLQSIYANVFYVCAWYPNSIIQIYDLSPVVDGKRVSVYNKIFQFIPEGSSSDHLSISAYLPCPCNDSNQYDPQYCLTAAENNSLKLETKVTLGQTFQIYLIGLDEVGSVGSARILYSEVNDASTGETLELARKQYSRFFNVIDKSCVPFEFTVFGKLPEIPKHGVLHLSFTSDYQYNYYFDFINCSVGFNLQSENEMFACVCGEFFMKSDIEKDFYCDSVSGMITRIDQRSWLSVVDDRIEYTRLCLPLYCNNIITMYTLTDNDILCDNNHGGRACGGCIDHYGRVFGSNSCRRCNNAWLATILLYATLGIILVIILYLLKLTVTMGTINGLIFFCNVMSINERLFFNTENSQFLFLRVVFSLFNLDLGFEMCFYHEMSQIVKTGLQFVFPVYLWLLVSIIIILGRYYFQRQQSSSHSIAVPVLATLILLSYSKLLRTIVSVFSFIAIQYTSEESNFSSSQRLVAWQPDPNVEYLRGGHIALFLIALVFMLLFIIPFALAMTFPTIVLRSKRMSRLFPLLDCFYAPYKHKCRYWFGVRLIVLIYLSGMESIIFSYQEELLLSSIVVILAFTIVQAYIHPFKNTVVNVLDLLFMSIFIVLSIIALYLFTTTSGHEKVNIVINVLGYVAFFIICLVAGFHINNAIKQTRWYKHIVTEWDTKLKLSKLQMHKQSSYKKTAIEQVKRDDISKDKKVGYCHYQESLLEYI